MANSNLSLIDKLLRSGNTMKVELHVHTHVSTLVPSVLNGHVGVCYSRPVARDSWP